jgi:hypothetical protein
MKQSTFEVSGLIYKRVTTSYDTLVEDPATSAKDGAKKKKAS